MLRQTAMMGHTRDCTADSHSLVDVESPRKLPALKEGTEPSPILPQRLCIIRNVTNSSKLHIIVLVVVITAAETIAVVVVVCFALFACLLSRAINLPRVAG